jgi:hypothetical protein
VNLGDKTAHEVVLSIEFPKGTDIKDFTIANTSGAAARKNQQELSSKENEKIISIKSLMPNELVTVSVLTNDYAKKLLKISARHTDGLAREGSLARRPTIELTKKGLKDEIPLLLALVLGLFLPIIVLYRLRSISGGSRSINNSAFMMLHQGLINDASRMLEKELNSRGGTSFELANLGLCKALSGDLDSANKLFSAAELYCSSKHIKALVAFNRSIVSFEAGDMKNAKQQFEIAIDLAKNKIKRYVKYSVYGQSIVRDIEGFDEYKHE